MTLATRRRGGRAEAIHAPGPLVTWLGFAAYLVAVKVALDLFLPAAFRDPAQAAAFGWLPIGVVVVLGGIGAVLASRTGFPDPLASDISWARRIGRPALIGLAFGAALIVFDVLTGYSRLAAAQHGLEQQYSDPLSMLLVFTATPAYVEAVYRLFPIPLVLVLVSTFARRGRWQETIFWILAVATSLLEPLSQTTWVLAASAPMFAFVFIHGFVLNFAQAALFRRGGFVAPIVLRTAFYLLWHVVYVH